MIADDDDDAVAGICRRCGEFLVPGADVTIAVCLDADVPCTARMECPTCGELYVRTVARPVEPCLVERGVRVVVWSMPAELAEPHEGPALTPADLIAFHEQLVEP